VRVCARVCVCVSGRHNNNNNKPTNHIKALTHHECEFWTETLGYSSLPCPVANAASAPWGAAGVLLLAAVAVAMAQGAAAAL
jgi:hypothetical protein